MSAKKGEESQGENELGSSKGLREERQERGKCEERLVGGRIFRLSNAT